VHVALCQDWPLTHFCSYHIHTDKHRTVLKKFLVPVSSASSIVHPAPSRAVLPDPLLADLQEMVPQNSNPSDHSLNVNKHLLQTAARIKQPSLIQQPHKTSNRLVNKINSSFLNSTAGATVLQDSRFIEDDSHAMGSLLPHRRRYQSDLFDAMRECKARKRLFLVSFF
jgi:hypothetical protein